jgi:hypothetical protein
MKPALYSCPSAALFWHVSVRPKINLTIAASFILFGDDLGLAGTANFLIGGHATVDGDVYGRSNGIVFAINTPSLPERFSPIKTPFLTLSSTKRWPRPPTPSV